MSKAEKLKKKIKQLKRKLEQRSSLPEKAKKEIKFLSRELKARDQAIVELQRKLSGRPDVSSDSAGATLAEYSREKGLAIEHKHAWKKHKFLCERYDVHLDSGHDKDKARAMANRDLVNSHGKKAGFTAEELRGILS